MRSDRLLGVSVVVMFGLLVRLIALDRSIPLFDASLSSYSFATIVPRSIDGQSVSFRNEEGVLTLANVWATWCGPCIEEIPDLVSLSAEFPQAVRLVGLALDDSATESFREFVRAKGINYPVVLANSLRTGALPQVEAVPTTFLIDSTGSIVRRYVGRINKSQLRKELNSLIPALQAKRSQRGPTE